MDTLKIGNKGVRVWTVSDTHGQHGYLNVPDVDVMIHTGDESNYRDFYRNRPEFENFVHWLKTGCAHIPVKLFTPGNHSSFVFHNQKKAAEMLKDAGAELLIDRGVHIDGLSVWMSPFTPKFGQWWYQLNREKSYGRYEEAIPGDVEIVGVHGMPKGIMDLAKDISGTLQQVGDSGLGKALKELQNLRLFTAGHIHSSHHIDNHGVLVRDGVYYANSSVVRDGEIGSGVYNDGFIFEL